MNLAVIPVQNVISDARPCVVPTQGGAVGYCKMEDVITGLRKLDSPFEGHPHWLKLPGVEVSSGSLGQGLGFAVGPGTRPCR